MESHKLIFVLVNFSNPKKRAVLLAGGLCMSSLIRRFKLDEVEGVWIPRGSENLFGYNTKAFSEYHSLKLNSRHFTSPDSREGISHNDWLVTLLKKYGRPSRLLQNLRHPFASKVGGKSWTGSGDPGGNDGGSIPPSLKVGLETGVTGVGVGTVSIEEFWGIERNGRRGFCNWWLSMFF